MNWQQIHLTLDYDQVEKALGISVLQRTNKGEHIASCPLSSHGGPDRNPSFSINIEKGVYGCFACGGGGTLPSLVMEMEGTTFEDAIHWLSRFSAIPADGEISYFIDQLERWCERKQADVKREGVLPWFRGSMLPQDEPGGADYLSGRHIGRDTCNKLDLRYVGKRSRGDYTGPCLVIPHYFQNELRGWQERWIEYGNAGFPKWIPKYTNSDDFPKRETVYRFGVSNKVILVESALTVATLDTYGHDACATFGASISTEQIRLLRTLKSVYLAYDNDSPGRKAIHLLSDHLANYCDVMIVRPPNQDKADLGDASKDEADKAIAQAQHSFLVDL